MKLSPPFDMLTIDKNKDIQLFNATQEKPNAVVFPEDLQELWQCTLAGKEFGYIGWMKCKTLFYPFCVDLNDKNLPVYSIDARWSEQEICLIHPQLKGFYGFLRLLKEHQKDWQSKLPSLLQSLPKSVEFPEFWNCLKQ